MTLADLLRETIDLPNDDVWENERTPTPVEQSRIVSIDFIDNPYHGDHYGGEGELCSMAPKDSTNSTPEKLLGNSIYTRPITAAVLRIIAISH